VEPVLKKICDEVATLAGELRSAELSRDEVVTRLDEIAQTARAEIHADREPPGLRPFVPLEERLAIDQKLLDALKRELPTLERMLSDMRRSQADRLYRFYYQSLKVYYLQPLTSEAVDLLRAFGREIDRPLCRRFEQIVAEGTGWEFDFAHNDAWSLHTRPIVEAYWHAMYFIEMMVRSATEMERAESSLPSGWAAILCLYGNR